MSILAAFVQFVKSPFSPYVSQSGPIKPHLASFDAGWRVPALPAFLRSMEV